MEPKFLKSEDVDFKEIPTEWRTVAALAKELNITGHFINTRIKKYSATHPEWSKKYIANGIVRDCLHPDLIKYIVEEFNNRGEQPPEGWITISKLRNKYGIAERTMEGFIEKYSQDHPGMDISARYLNSIGKLALFVHPDVAIYVDGLMQDRKTKIVPPGWFSNRTLAEKIGVAQTTVFRIAQGYRESNPEWFNFFLNQDKKSFEYYHPDLVAIVKNEIVGRRKEIPPGWLLIADIITVCGAQHGVPDYNFIYQVASEFRKTNPEYFGFYTAKNGKFLEFYHPDLVKIISERFRSRLTVKQEVKEIVIKKRKEVEKKRIEREGVDLAPMGWLTLNKLIVVLRTGPQIIASIVDAYRSDHPDWFKVFQYKKGGSGEHFHPDLVKRLEEDLRSRGEHPPEGWRTASDILDDFPIARKSFEELMKSFRISHPKWIHNYLNRLNQLVEHLHPALVKELGMLISQRGDSAPRGWLTIGAVANKLNVTFATVMHVVDKYRLSNSGWIKKYLNSSNNLYEHIHPDLIKEVEKKLSSRQKPPVGWESLNDLRRLFKFDPSTLENFYKKYEKTHPEWRKIFLNENGKMVPYWHPDFILLFKETFTSRQKAPSGWKTLGPVAQELDISPQTVESLMERFRDLHPEWFKEYLNKGKNFYEHFHPDLINELKKILFDKNKIITAGWKKMGDLSREFGVSYTFLQKFILPYRTSNPDWIFKDKIKDRAIIYEYYHPDLIKIIKDAIKLREKPPSGWKTRNKIFSELGLSSGAESVHRFIVAQLKEHPEWAHRYLDSVGKLAEYLHPELVRLVVEHVGVRNEAPSGWLEKITLVHELKLNHGTILNFIQKYRTTRPEWFVPYLNKEKRLVEFLHPELVELIRAHYIFKKRYVFEKKDDVEKSKELEDRLKKDLSKDEQEKDGLSQNIRSLIGVFGASRAIDLLYKFRPEFRGIPVERVKSCLGEYLGDFLAAKHEFHLKDLGEAKEFLSDTTFREGLYETMKSHCLQYYFQERKKGVEGDSYEIIYGYLVHIIDELGDDTNEFLDQVIEDVVTYFADAIQKFHKPEKFVDHLAEGREFPDLNQKINMKELQDKKRMLIADEMGLGKSASVIMAKEHMKLGCAVVVVPAVVVGTWQDYLSDDPERKGYFKPGQAPRVLVVENPEQLRDVTKDQYDYIIVSHGRLNGRYAPLLEQLDPDMLIVDEVHELKNIKAGKKAAVRSRALMPLVRKLEQGEKENKYLAILSGTPIPNKVRDVALTLKMLYPEKFADMSSAELVRDIIHGDAINLRALLIPHMQMKELEDVVEMPERAEKIVEVKLSPDEADMYEAILELDELTATEKMKTLMKFLMNPALLDTTPGIEGAKIVALRNELQEIFKTKSKVLLLVNHLISGILRGRNAVIDQLSLPPNVKIETIHGEDDKKQRPKIQNEFNNGVDPMLLGGSGDAMGVGISLVGGEVTIVYSEPWTESDLRQQKARVFRPGLQHPIQERTMIVSGTLDEGIHKYIARKYAAVEKILKGIPISELDKRMLEKAESNPTGEDADFELNPELARTYYSWRQRLSQMFGHMKELGEESIVKFLETWGADYAEGYRQVGARSYQANTNRVSGTLINEMIQKSGRHPAALAILDVASGPEMLRHHIGNANQESVFSLDINGHHFKDSTSGKTRTGSWTKMPIKSGSVDYLNCAMAFQDSAFIPSKGKFERIDVLREMNRVLKNGGRAVISMIYSMQMLDMEKFKLFAEATGFHLVEDYSGLAENGGRFSSQIITLEKFADAQKTAQDIFKEVGQENHSGLKMGNTEKILKNYREILTGFFLDGRAKTVDLNDSDRAVLHEEKELTDKVAELKVRYKTIRDIPPEEVISNGFVRMLAGKNYLLFKRLTKASGVVILT